MAVLFAFVVKTYECTSQFYFRLCRDGDMRILVADNLLVVEPIGGIQLANLVQHLGIQLLVVNVTRIVNQLPIGNSQADVATASYSIRQRVRIVGSRDKGSIAGTVVL